MNAKCPRPASFAVLVAEDAQAVRRRLVKMLRAMPGVDEVLEARDCAATLLAVTERRPDVLLMNLFLRDGTGFDVLRALARGAQRPRVVVLSTAGQEALRQPLVEAGAELVFDQDNDLMAALEAIGTMAAGNWGNPA